MSVASNFFTTSYADIQCRNLRKTRHTTKYAQSLPLSGDVQSVNELNPEHGIQLNKKIYAKIKGRRDWGIAGERPYLH